MQARIAKIREYVALLRRIRGLADERRFVKDPLIYGNAERSCNSPVSPSWTSVITLSRI